MVSLVEEVGINFYEKVENKCFEYFIFGIHLIFFYSD